MHLGQSTYLHSDAHGFGISVRPQNVEAYGPNAMLKWITTARVSAGGAGPEGMPLWCTRPA